MTNKVFSIEQGPDQELVFRFHRPTCAWGGGPAQEHLRNSVKEVLLSLRSLLDVAIEATEKKEKGKTSRTRIKVQ